MSGAHMYDTGGLEHIEGKRKAEGQPDNEPSPKKLDQGFNREEAMRILGQKTVFVLKYALEQLSLKRTGKKQELIDRLVEFLTIHPEHWDMVRNIDTSDSGRDQTAYPPPPPVHLPRVPASGLVSHAPPLQAHHADSQHSALPLPQPTEHDGVLHFTQPRALHDDTDTIYKGQGEIGTLTYTFCPSEIPVPQYPTLEELNDSIAPGSLTDHFRVFYQHNQWSDFVCDHDFLFLPVRIIRITLHNHDELFNYNKNSLMECKPECPFCGADAETWSFATVREANHDNPLLNWITQYMWPVDHCKLAFGEQADWEVLRTVARICKVGHISITLAEQKMMKAPFWIVP